MSRSSFEVVRITTGMRASGGWRFIAASTSRPCAFGSFRSSRTTAGFSSPASQRGIQASASSPSRATSMRLTSLRRAKARKVRSRSTGLSSTSRIGGGFMANLLVGLAILFMRPSDYSTISAATVSRLTGRMGFCKLGPQSK